MVNVKFYSKEHLAVTFDGFEDEVGVGMPLETVIGENIHVFISGIMIIHPSKNKKGASVEEKSLMWSLNTQTLRCKKGLENVFFKNTCCRVNTHSNSSLATASHKLNLVT